MVLYQLFWRHGILSPLDLDSSFLFISEQFSHLQIKIFFVLFFSTFVFMKATSLILCIFNFLFISVFFFLFLFIYLFIFGCVGSSFLCEGFLQLRQAGATLHSGARASHYRGLSCFGAQAPDPQAQQLWLTGLVALRHVGSSQTRARTRVPFISRQILNHCATREAQFQSFLKFFSSSCSLWHLPSIRLYRLRFS